MARISSFSIATGDLRIFSATRDAVTTTSLPSTTVCVVNSMSSFESRLVISYSCGSNPIEVKISLNGNFNLVLNLNNPELLVIVPATVPLILTLTFGMGSFDSRLATRPEISISELSCCAVAAGTRKNTITITVNTFL